MKVELNPDQEAFIRQAIKDGRVASTEDAVQEALRLWEYRERRRGEILAAVEAAEALIDHGEGLAMNEESIRKLSAEVKRRGRTRLESDR